MLVVPDDFLAAELGESFLDRGSFGVRVAATAEQALTIARLARPSLVVFRDAVPDMELAPFCRELRKACSAKLLMLTEQIGDPALSHAEELCDAHLISPVETSQLLATIAELLDVAQRRSRRVPLEVLVHTEGFVDANEAVDTTLANAINISEDGMRLEASRPFGLGSRGQVQFFLPDGTERLALDAVVRVAVDEVRLTYALEFVDLAPQHRTAIRGYVASCGDGS
jgi:DNA-binding response OmpR family regulator